MKKIKKQLFYFFVLMFLPLCSIYADINEGELKWVVGDSHWITASPALSPDENVIYYSGGDDNVTAVSKNGFILWRVQPTMIGIDSSPVYRGGYIYVGGGRLAKITNGVINWSKVIENIIKSTPAIDSNGIIYIGNMAKKICAVASNGVVKWCYETGDIIVASAVIGADNTIYIGSLDHKLYALDPDGSLKWEFVTNGEIHSTPAIDSDGTIYIGSNDHKLYAINPNGTKKWEFITEKEVYSSPAIGKDGTIYVGGIDHKLYAINPDGTEKWHFDAGGEIYSSPAIGEDGVIYFGCINHKLFAINPDGTKRWEYQTEGEISYSSPAIASDGTIYICDTKGKLYAVHSSSKGLANSPWPKYHHDNQNTGVASAINEQECNRENLQLCDNEHDCINAGGFWNNGICNPQPQIDNCSPDNLTACLNENDCVNAGGVWDNNSCNNRDNYTLLWEFNAGAWIYSSPAINDNGTIFIGSDNGRLYAINPNGTEKWVFVGDRFSSIIGSPAVDIRGNIYVGYENGKLYAINPDGTKKWEFETGNHVNTTPALSPDGTIYFGSEDKKLYALNLDGTKKWEFNTGKATRITSPIIDSDGTIYFAAGRNLFAINPDGTEKWHFHTSGQIYSTPALDNNSVVYVGSWDDKLYAINPDGTEKWHFATGDDIYSSPTIGSNGTIYIGSWDHKLYAVNPDGTEKWHFNTGDRIYSSPTIGSDGTIYVGSWDHKLYAINPDGTEKWHFDAGGKIWFSSAAINNQGVLYIGVFDTNKLIAIQTDSHGLADSSWPKFHKDNRNSGANLDGNPRECNEENLQFCDNENDCVNAGGIWINFFCHPNEDNFIPFNFEEGWDMRALPVDVDNGVPVDNFKTNSINTIWKWNGNSWKVWSPSNQLMELIKKYNLLTFERIFSGEGFWINSKSSVTVQIIKGKGYGLEKIKLEYQWNLVGIGTNIFSADLRNLIGIKSVWKWNKKWMVWSPSQKLMEIINNYQIPVIEKIQPGYGIWINKE